MVFVAQQMARFSIFVYTVLLAGVAVAEEYGGDGLYKLYQGEYASGYDNYEPHDYQFDYAVSDPHTGDHKSQWEVKEKGVVKGGYSLLEPDGTTRIVEYIADDNGFRAVVKKIGTPIHPAPVKYEEPKPLYDEGYNAYSGYYGNYVPVQPGPEYVVPKVAYYKPEIAAAPGLSYYGESKPELEEKVPYIPFYPQIKPQEEKVPVLPIYVQPKPEEKLPIVPFYPQLKPQVEEKVEYHGFTGNSDDDSAYTKYEGEDEKGEGYFGGIGYDFEESKPKIVSVPYKALQGYQKPVAYQYIYKQVGGY